MTFFLNEIYYPTHLLLNKMVEKSAGSYITRPANLGCGCRYIVERVTESLRRMKTIFTKKVL